ncbi:helix-turn-helix domain-containing protein [Panacagrimonas perspica]|nr:AraC family transcriptional regulator [Panacagrimonas perspica]
MCAALMGSPEAQQRTADAIRDGFRNNPSAAADFDVHFFGGALPCRRLDHRVRRVIDLIAAPETSRLSAEQYASQVFLSSSRFMHLFSEQTQTTFRRFRSWKRARRFLTMLTGQPRLVDVALDAGYADSTHLSRCVRSCYGYTPAVMCGASRALAVVARA